MNSLFKLLLSRRALAFLLLAVAVHVHAWAQADLTPKSETTFVFFARSNGHVKFSTQEDFQQVVDQVQEYLRENGIGFVSSVSASSSDSEVPLFAVEEMTRDSNATYLLYVIVDSKTLNWPKVTVRCYDATGREIWHERAYARGVGSGVNATRDALQKLTKQLNKRIGQPGLLQAASEQKPPFAAATETQVTSTRNLEDSGETIRLANGTPVHLLVAESISSKTAKPGDTVKLQVFGDVKVGDLVVIANKSPAVATIEAAEGAGRAWRTGTIVLKLHTVMLLNHQEHPLLAWSAVKGAATDAGLKWANATQQTYGLALFVLPFAPLQHGNQAFLYRGTALEAVIDGDVLLSRAAIEEAQPKPAEPRHGPASVTFYYPEIGPGSSVDIWCGDVKVGRLRRGGKFTLALPPGSYRLKLAKKVKPGFDTPLDAEDGGEQYVSVIASQHQHNLDIYWRLALSVVPHDVGEAQSADTTPATVSGSLKSCPTPD